MDLDVYSRNQQLRCELSSKRELGNPFERVLIFPLVTKADVVAAAVAKEERGSRYRSITSPPMASDERLNFPYSLVTLLLYRPAPADDDVREAAAAVENDRPKTLYVNTDLLNSEEADDRVVDLAVFDQPAAVLSLLRRHLPELAREKIMRRLRSVLQPVDPATVIYDVKAFPRQGMAYVNLYSEYCPRFGDARHVKSNCYYSVEVPTRLVVLHCTECRQDSTLVE